MRVLKHGILTVGFALGLAFPAAFAVAASGAAKGVTSLSIALAPTVVLDYYKSIAITITSADIAALIGTSSNTSSAVVAPATVSAGKLVANAGLVTNAAVANLSAVALTLKNAFSVRAIDSASGSTTISIGLASQTGTRLRLRNGTATIVASAPTATFTGNGSLVTPVYGSIGMTLKLTSANIPGVYSTAAGADIFINATAT